MRQRCEYCDNWIDDTDAVCPHCGAPNAHMMVSGEGVPKTIEELQEFAAKHNLPLKDMRFFIGEDYKEPRAFGIYRDGPDVVVYKNKADGSRAVRYRGTDEAYAVNELYQKMKSEVANQRRYQAKAQVQTAKKMQRKSRTVGIVGIVALVIALMTFMGVVFGGPSRGYYTYEDTTYYYQDDSWYYYDTNSSTWERDSEPPTPLTESADTYWEGTTYDSSVDAADFESSGYYVEPSSSDDDSSSWDDDWDDDDWDWDSSDTWDSGATNWDSDW